MEYLVWQRLAALAQQRGNTLSETIINLLEDAERKEKYDKTLFSLRNDLQAILGKKKRSSPRAQLRRRTPLT